jgi:SAM-dependent methyltransferase
MAGTGFEALIAEADQAPFEGWDFSHLAGRKVEAPPPFDYLSRARMRLAGAEAALDLGTGGGEVLSKLAPFHGLVVATEAWPPNALVAARRLSPLGASVALVEGAPENWETLASPFRDRPALPFADASFDLVIDRHESYLPAEVFRVLRAGGRFLTQQCGGTHHADLNDHVGITRPRYRGWRLEAARAQLDAVGLVEIVGEEACGETAIHDVGAVVYYLRALPWQAPDFRAGDHLAALRAIHERTLSSGPLTVRSHHFLLEARKAA